MQKIYVIGKLLDIVHVTIVPLAHKCAAGFYMESMVHREGVKTHRGNLVSPLASHVASVALEHILEDAVKRNPYQRSSF